MMIELNGDPCDVPAGATVAQVVVLSGAGHEPRGVAVAVDGEVVPRSTWDDVQVAADQKVEVWRAVRGG
jgi:sulfur carrier protein